MDALLETVLHHVQKIKTACAVYSIQDEYPVFFERLTYFISTLTSDTQESLRQVIEHNAQEDLIYALIETHTMIAIDEDLDGYGLEQMTNLWEHALLFCSWREF